MSPISVKNPIQPGDGDPRHGSVGAYTNHRCRCATCRAGWAAWYADYSKRPGRRKRHSEVEKASRARRLAKP